MEDKSYLVNPDWLVEDKDIIGEDKGSFETLHSSLLRIKLLKELGMLNLYKKGLNITDPYATLYDVIEAIDKIQIYNGRVQIIKPETSTWRAPRYSGVSRAWTTSIPGIFATKAVLKFPKYKSQEDNFSFKGQFKYEETTNAGDWTSGISMKQMDTDKTLVCIVLCTLQREEDSVDSVIAPPLGWEKVNISQSNVSLAISGGYSKLAIFKKPTIEELENDIVVTIPSGGRAAMSWIYLDEVDYESSSFSFTDYIQSSLDETLLQKVDNYPYFWIVTYVDAQSEANFRDVQLKTMRLSQQYGTSFVDILYDEEKGNKYLSRSGNKMILGMKIGGE